MLKWIFQLGNDKDNFQKHKFVKIFGFKIYLTNFALKPKFTLKQRYYKYLENNINKDKSDFINITNAPYKANGGGGVVVMLSL